MPRKKRRNELVMNIYIEDDRGLVFVTENNKEFSYKFYHDASGAVSDITLEEICTKKKSTSGAMLQTKK